MMKRILIVTAAVLLAVLARADAAFAQTVSPEDRDRAVKYLESTRDNVVQATKGLTEEQWNYKPSVFKWSVAQVVEHIAAAEDLLRGLLVQNVLKAPPAPGLDTKAGDQRVLAMVPDRSVHVEAPPPLRPTNRFSSPQEALKHFVESRAKTIELLQNTPDLRAHATDSPIFKKLDGYEWVLFIAAHSERHTKQLNEVKADPKFPK